MNIKDIKNPLEYEKMSACRKCGKMPRITQKLTVNGCSTTIRYGSGWTITTNKDKSIVEYALCDICSRQLKINNIKQKLDERH